MCLLFLSLATFENAIRPSVHVPEGKFTVAPAPGDVSLAPVDERLG